VTWNQKISLWVVLTVLLLSALSQVCVFLVAKPPATTAVDLMVEHSLGQLKKNDDTAIAEKLQMKQMEIKVDTHMFTASREKAKQIIKLACQMPDKLCDSMALTADMIEGKYHKKDAVPLDGHRGSYFSVWIWVKTLGVNDDVQVALKTASMEYQLRDVVTYIDKVEYEPIIKCETELNSWWFLVRTREHCREVSQKKIVTTLPVFTPMVLRPDEMAQVDTYIESMLAQKVIDNTGGKQLPTAIEA